MTQDAQLSTQVRSNFARYAKKDEKTGEAYMTEEEFVNAIAPTHEDYVCDTPAPPASIRLRPMANADTGCVHSTR